MKGAFLTLAVVSPLLLFSAVAGMPSEEARLVAALPDIFGKSAAHYRALDAAATPLMKDAEGKIRLPHGWRGWLNEQRLNMQSVFEWTAGHFPGSLWYLYEATGDAFFRDRAVVWTEVLEPNKTVDNNHDVGFIMYCSFGNARRILKTDRYDAILAETAASLSRRFNERLGLIRSWGKIEDKDNFEVIPDNMMNLELLEAVSKMTGERRFDRIARSHADVTMKHHFRADGGTYHVLNYDQRPGFLGSVQGIRRGQGLSCETAWSRGQSWAIYGYTMMYRETKNPAYLAFAQKVADFAIGHPNMPADGVPHWDYGAPGEERDSSAAAIMASALLELSGFTGGGKGAAYRAFAVRQLLALASPDYFSAGGEVGHFLLKHGVGAKPMGGEIDTPLNYGDYYFLEALLRLRNMQEKTVGTSAVSASAQVVGYHLDISNDRIPRQEMLYRIVDILAKLGYNHLQMNTEHSFAYSRHEAVWKDASPVTPAEARQLDDYCAARGIELVPNQNSFGHLWRWLRLPEYNHLSEMPQGGCRSSFLRKPLPRPMSLCPTDPRSIDLIAGLYDELLPCFRSRQVNVGMDETFELDDVTGTGRSAAEIKAKGPGRVYLDYFRKIHKLVSDRGHTMMFWGDIILHHPELIPEIPEDVTCLDWGYTANFPFDEHARKFAEARRRFLMCPGTRAWGSITGNVPEMMSNVGRAVEAGRKHGADGCLLCDWGDGGSPSPWVVALPSIVYLSLKVRGEDPDAARLAAAIDGVMGCRCGEALVEYGNIYRDVKGRNNDVANEYCYALRKGELYDRHPSVTDETLAAARRRHQRAKELFDAAHASQWLKDEFAALDLICTAAEERVKDPTAANFRARFEPEYRRLWLTNSRPGGLEYSLNVNFGFNL